MRLFRSAEEKQRNAEAEEAFRQAMTSLGTSDPEHTRQIVASLERNGTLAGLGGRDRRKLGEQAFLQYANNVLADDHLTEDEEDALGAVGEAIGYEQADLAKLDLYTRLQVAKLNDGRLPVVDAPHLMAKRGEIVHLETAAHPAGGPRDLRRTRGRASAILVRGATPALRIERADLPGAPSARDLPPIAGRFESQRGYQYV